jgi:hypothetical protein
MSKLVSPSSVLASLVMKSWLWMVGVVGLLACDGTQAAGPVAPAPPSERNGEIALHRLLPPGAVPVGVTVDQSGKRYVLDRRSGLYRLDGNTAALVVSTNELAAVAGLGLDLELTDVAAFGPGTDQFAFTAENEAFVFDVRSRTISFRFCYLPSTTDTPPPVDARPSISQSLRMNGIQVKERTESVAYDPQTGLLVAQPRTIVMTTGAIAGAELFTFRPPADQPFDTRVLPDPGFMAGGMTVSGLRVLLGVHGQIYQMSSFTDPTLLLTFDTPVEITGMARDLDGDLLVLDGAGGRLLKLRQP